MESKIVSRRTPLTAVLTGLVALSPALLFYFIPKISIHDNPVVIVENTSALSNQEQASPFMQASVGLPVRLRIPGINIDSNIEHVGLASDGAMDVPKKQDDVAWFELGPHPGEVGAAVIAGHYGIKDGKGSVFDNLYKLRKGDKVYVKDDQGITISFVVRESRRYDVEADASDVFGSNDGKSHLNLITCEGVWDERTQQYSKRLVVFTDRE